MFADGMDRVARRFLIAATLLLASVGLVAAGGNLETGTVVTVRANSIWFEDAGALAHWQEFKRSISTEAFQAYEHDALANRQAWQFTLPLTVKVLGYDAARDQLHVELQTPGRFMGTAWYLDAHAVEP